jgi:hypothetical protein
VTALTAQIAAIWMSAAFLVVAISVTLAILWPEPPPRRPPGGGSGFREPWDPPPGGLVLVPARRVQLCLAA